MSKLFVTTDFPPDAAGGGPAVVRQMLKGFPGEVHWWSVRQANAEKLQDIIRRDESAEASKVAGRGTSVEGFQLSGFHCCPPGKLMPAKKLPKLRAFLMEHFWAPRAARSLRRTIKKLEPDCIWAVPHDFSVFPLAKVFADDNSRWTLGRRTRLHVTIQDYPDAHFHGRTWGEARVQRMARMQETLYARATTCDATSLPMLEDLETRTGRRGLQCLHQGLEAGDFAHLESKLVCALPSTLDPQPSAHIKIAYAGTILCEREFTLFVELLDSIRNSICHQSSVVELHLYGAHSYADRRWFRPWITEHGNLPEAKLLTELRKCDWGFIPMSLDDADPRYNRYSFPTKFITYLAAGLPVISMGHPESSVMKMASAYNVGKTIRSPSPSPEELAKTLFSPHSKKAHLPEVLRCAREQFDAEAMRAKLWQAFGVSE